MDAILSMPWLYAELAGDESNAQDENENNKESDDNQKEAMQIGRIFILTFRYPL